MFTKVMAAIDGSKTSLQALTEAKRMVETPRGTLRIVYAASDSEVLDQEAGRKLLKLAEATVGTGLTVETRLVQAVASYGLNGIAEAIGNAANEWGADLVVVGTSRRRGLKRLVIGSVAEQLVAKIDASILLVRPH